VSVISVFCNRVWDLSRSDASLPSEHACDARLRFDIFSHWGNRTMV
jgi:hypothetical protein